MSEVRVTPAAGPKLADALERVEETVALQRVGKGPARVVGLDEVTGEFVRVTPGVATALIGVLDDHAGKTLDVAQAGVRRVEVLVGGTVYELTNRGDARVQAD